MQELTKTIKDDQIVVRDADRKTFVQIVENVARFVAQNATVLVVAPWIDAQTLLNSLHSFNSAAVQRSKILLDSVTGREMREIDSALFDLDTAITAIHHLRNIYQH